MKKTNLLLSYSLARLGGDVGCPRRRAAQSPTTDATSGNCRRLAAATGGDRRRRAGPLRAALFHRLSVRNHMSSPASATKAASPLPSVLSLSLFILLLAAHTSGKRATRVRADDFRRRDATRRFAHARLGYSGGCHVTAVDRHLG